MGLETNRFDIAKIADVCCNCLGSEVGDCGSGNRSVLFYFEGLTHGDKRDKAYSVCCEKQKNGRCNLENNSIKDSHTLASVLGCAAISHRG